MIESIDDLDAVAIPLNYRIDVASRRESALSFFFCLEGHGTFHKPKRRSIFDVGL